MTKLTPPPAPGKAQASFLEPDAAPATPTPPATPAGAGGDQGEPSATEFRSMLINSGKDFEAKFGKDAFELSVEETVDQMAMRGDFKDAGSGVAFDAKNHTDDRLFADGAAPEKLPTQYEVTISLQRDGGIRLFECEHEGGSADGAEINIAPDRIVSFCRKVLSVAGFRDFKILDSDDNDLADDGFAPAFTGKRSSAAATPEQIVELVRAVENISGAAAEKTKPKPEPTEKDEGLGDENLIVPLVMPIWVYENANEEFVIAQDQMALYGEVTRVYIPPRDMPLVLEAIAKLKKA